MYGFYRIAAAVPKVRVADTDYNTDAIIAMAGEAAANSAAAVLFPEMAVTGYTCADLFHQPLLVKKSLEAVIHIASATKRQNTAVVVGAPFFWNSALYNCAFILHNGEIKGIVPKSNLPNYREYYEKRWFKSGKEIQCENVEINGKNVPFGTNLIFEYGEFFKLSVEICEDLWFVIPPSSYHATAGATIILNPSASNELVSKADYRRELVKQQSARCIAGYIYASSGVFESTTDLVFGGHAMAVEDGAVLAENERFARENSMIFSDIDCAKLVSLRLSSSSYPDSRLPGNENYRRIKLNGLSEIKDILRSIDPHPFVPSNAGDRHERCREIVRIQSSGLAKRFEHTGLNKAVIGISGGLDSTLALLITAETFRQLGRDMKSIISITMPGFGTTERTFSNSTELCGEIGTDFRQIDIKDVCLKHFRDIGHDPATRDVTYENVQARERTQILMDIANKEKGLVIGTGDLSEMALGWSTYNGDHMSMYAVNCSVPKTLIRYLINWLADNSRKKLRDILLDIIETPVSPELLPSDTDSGISQRTEDILGPYELHDFFLYHMIKYGAHPEKIKYLALKAFGGKYTSDKIKKYLTLFMKRFFSNQFKRTCVPDGPKVGTISLSPRGDWRMPADASSTLWLK